MKKNIEYIIILALVVWIVTLLTCNDTPTNTKSIEKENKLLKKKVNNLNNEYSILSHFNDTLKNKYSRTLKEQKNIREVAKKRYLTIDDAIIKDTIECLPKIYVDSLIFSQDSINKVAAKRFYTDSLMIDNLISQNKIKDTIILNDSIIISTTKKELKKEKRKKWRFFGLGAISGYICGKLF